MSDDIINNSPEMKDVKLEDKIVPSDSKEVSLPDVFAAEIRKLEEEQAQCKLTILGHSIRIMRMEKDRQDNLDRLDKTHQSMQNKIDFIFKKLRLHIDKTYEWQYDPLHKKFVGKKVQPKAENIKEGVMNKGGVNTPPNTPRPEPPKGQIIDEGGAR